ncbi:MAG: class I SAM-dependent methyltransferase [bacterium]|nr:class I SAM-dependent methyltransferase [bacterium]
MRVVDLDRDMSDVIPTGTSRDAEFLFERMTRETLAAVRARGAVQIVDSAAGLGQDDRALASEGAWAICAEPSRRMTELGRLIEAKENVDLKGSVHWVRAWSEHLPFRDDSLDAAYCKGALDHFDNPDACIREMARVTKPDGRVVLAVANFGSLGCRVQKFFDRFPERLPGGRRPYHVPSDHFTRYDLRLLRRQIEEHIEIEEWLGISLLWGVQPWANLLGRLSENGARRLLEWGDRIARRFPRLSDVLIVSGRPTSR